MPPPPRVQKSTPQAKALSQKGAPFNQNIVGFNIYIYIYTYIYIYIYRGREGGRVSKDGLQTCSLQIVHMVHIKEKEKRRKGEEKKTRPCCASF